MAYTFNLIYGVNYSRNNQVVFPENLAGVSMITQTCTGNFFTYQNTLRAVISDITAQTTLKSIVGARVLPNNEANEEYYYFVTGYNVIAPNVVEFTITPDYFHTYLNNGGCAMSLLKTNYEPVINAARYAFYREPKNVSQEFLPVFQKLTPENNYYVVATFALEDKRVVNVIFNYIYPILKNAIAKAAQLSFAVKYTEKIIIGETQTETTYNAKVLRTFIFPSSLVDTIVTEGVSDTFKYYITERTPDGTEYTSEVIPGGNKTTNFNIDTVNFKENDLRIGTQFDNISIKHNFLKWGKSNNIKVKIFIDLDTIGAYLFCGDTQLDILRGFELETNASDTAQYKAQQGISDAIQKVAGVAGAVGSIGAGVAAAGMGNYLQAGLSITNGATQLASTLTRDIEQEKRVTANAGGHVGVANLSGDWHGISFAAYFTLDETAMKQEIELYGYTIPGDLCSVVSFRNEIKKRTFFLAQYVYDFNMSIPTPAATELEQTFMNGIFIRPFNSQ